MTTPDPGVADHRTEDDAVGDDRGASQTGPRWRRRTVVAIGIAVALWMIGAAWLLVAARGQLTDARDDLRSLRDELDGADLLGDEGTERLETVAAELRSARSKVRSPLITPLRALPVVGRQIRSVDALALAARETVDISTETVERVRVAVEAADEPDTDRVALVAAVRSAAADAGAALAAIELGPDEALIGPLGDARTEFAEDLAELRDLTGDVEVAATGVGALLDSGECYLLFAANNAEMRAGSGMFLQAGELCFDGGEFSLTDLQSTTDLRLPDDAVAIPDEDLAARWGPLLPNAEFRNLALTPRFDATAELAAEMWQASQGREVGGVLAVDPVALRALLDSTGPIDVEGRTYSADNVVDALLVEQYEGFLDDDFDAGDRRDRLGEVAQAAIAAFDSGGWSVDTMIDELPEAVERRHLLGWSADPAIQEAFESMGMAGAMTEESVSVSVLNRGGGGGGGKLDPFLEIDARVRVDDEVVDGSRGVTIELRIENTVEEGVPTYVETVTDDVRFGLYEGILAVNLPATAQDGRIEVDGEPLSLYSVGRDGPTRLVATSLRLPAERSARVEVRFRLPEAIASIRIEPSARVPEIDWQAPSVPDGRDAPFAVRLYG